MSFTLNFIGFIHILYTIIVKVYYFIGIDMLFSLYIRVLYIWCFNSIDICINSIDNSIIYIDKFFIYLIYISIKAIE